MACPSIRTSFLRFISFVITNLTPLDNLFPASYQNKVMAFFELCDLFLLYFSLFGPRCIVYLTDRRCCSVVVLCHRHRFISSTRWDSTPQKQALYTTPQTCIPAVSLTSLQHVLKTTHKLYCK